MSIAVGVEVGYEILKVVDRNGWLNQFTDAFRKKHRVLVLGSTGVGKTQFLRSFGDMFAEGLNYAARTQFPTAKRIELDGNLFEFIDTPGQELHQSRRITAIANAMREGYTGIINIVSYGYHEYGLNADKVLAGSSVKDSYLQSHRDVEIRLLGEWSPWITDQWVFTIITKADLWWDSQEDVIEYYERGKYHQVLQGSNPKIEAMVSPYSSVSSKFYGVTPTSGHFNDEQRKIYRSKVFEGLIEAISRVKT